MTDPKHRAGFVAILGAPNVGKSTLLNALLKFKLSIVSSKPQTTRHRILGILNEKDYQICFVDTPGWIHKTEDRLQASLLRSTCAAAKGDADVIILMVEPEPPEPEILAGLVKLTAQEKPIILAVNKIDRMPDYAQRKEAIIDPYSKTLQITGENHISALKGDGVAELLKAVINHLPESPAYYEKGHLTDRWERFFVAEIIREEIFKLYRKEVPHACAVVIEDFKERKGCKDQISAFVYVERPPQKGILIGHRGEAIRKLTEASLRSVEKFLDRKAGLKLRIKVRKNWRKDLNALKEFGY